MGAAGRRLGDDGGMISGRKGENMSVSEGSEHTETIK